MSSTRTDTEPGRATQPADRLAAITPRRRIPDSLVAGALVLPTLVLLGSFVLGPLVGNIYVSAHDRRLITRTAPFIGAENWSQVLSDPDLWAAARFTFVLTAILVIVIVAGTLSLALCLHDRPVVKRFVAPAVVLPAATSLAIAAVSWRLIFGIDGPVNEVAGVLGIHGPNWLHEQLPARLVVVVVGAWADAGLIFLLFSAALSRLPSTLVDAAQVFGRWHGVAHKLRLFVPLLGRTVAVAVVLATVSALQSFDAILLLTNGGPVGATRTLAFLAWERSFRFYDLGEGAVIATVLSVVIFVITAAEGVWLRRALDPTRGKA